MFKVGDRVQHKITLQLGTITAENHKSNLLCGVKWDNSEKPGQAELKSNLQKWDY
jgi:hypothetical protein